MIFQKANYSLSVLQKKILKSQKSIFSPPIEVKSLAGVAASLQRKAGTMPVNSPLIWVQVILIFYLF